MTVLSWPLPSLLAGLVVSLGAGMVWRSAWRDADRNWLSWLLAGNLIFIPIGIAMLAWLPQTLLRLLIGCSLLATAIGLRLASTRPFAPSLSLRIGAGVVSGLLTGVAASGGGAAAMLMAAARLPAAALRESNRRARPRGRSCAPEHSIRFDQEAEAMFAKAQAFVKGVCLVALQMT